MEYLNLNNTPSIQVEVIENINKINPEDWNACVCKDAPFARHEFLSALEDSQCVQPQQGWMAHHLVIKGEDGKIKACAPMYLKGHSYGEYVFDWAWADAYERAGGKYYPKLQSAIPFTPVTGPRFLLHPNATAEDRNALISAMIKQAVDLKISSLHVTFSTRDEWEHLKEHGFLQRIGHQYHWKNRGYSHFDDFLNALSSRKRKSIRKERKTVADSGVKHLILSGDAIKEHHWDAFFSFYIDTSGRKWGQAYLNRAFFSLLGQRMGQHIVLILCEYEGRIVAGALNIKGSDTLYGRYWGCLEDFRFLHFETCYYQAIDYAIAHNLKRVEAGAQGEHKIQRGYLPVETYSAHWIADPNFARAVDDFLEHDKRVNTHHMKELSTLSPYKQE